MIPFKQLIWGIALTLSVVQAFASSLKPSIEASSWVLYDETSRFIIASENPDKRLEPASLTKLMSAYLVFEALEDNVLDLEQTVPVSEKAWKTGGSKMFIEPRKPVTVKQLLLGMIVQSGNDATIALAEAVAGSEEVFVTMMNQKAAELGLKNTHYVNSTGLPAPDHYSSARDIAILSTALVRNFPEHYKIYSIKEFQYNLPKPQYNRNRLLWIDPNVDGIKTGHTESAGYCLAASAKINNRRLISVVLGTKSDQMRAQESLKLLNFGFRQYEDVLLYQKDTPIERLPVFKGTLNSVAVGFPRDFYITIPKGKRDQITAKLVYERPLMAPITVGQNIGTLKIELAGKAYVDYPVYALESVSVTGWLGRTFDTIRLWFQ